ncbi:hypothetical protein Hbl1158_10890 [Halobaculum sp. CBA1158]|uniref:hypothetical protein n=1 Tax=Halobaculum sp. CBA1158 TaxID=2904243 RepID=UPI001F483C51|nr:hypothetical protein [Halobaculum sp. CBA1158]UIO99038.1 hypothetical protein Hbl1158_10890 [Halobaculum sp. CBA1158]
MTEEAGESPATLELPTGETVETGTVFSFNGYPYRFVPLDHPEYRFRLAPLYWGGGDMDVPFADRDELVEQWGPESRGVLTDEEWRDWLIEARADDRFGEDELDAVERELLGEEGGLLDRISRAFRG